MLSQTSNFSDVTDHRQARVVICVHGVGVTGLAMVRSLGRHGIPVHVVSIKNHKNLAGRSRYCRKLWLSDSEEAKDLLDVLNELADKCKHQPVLMFDNDKMMLALGAHADSLGTRFHIPPALADIDGLTDKLHQLQLAEQAGICTPKTWTPSSWDDFAAIDQQNSHQQLIAKPNPKNYPPGSLPFKVIVGADASDLERQLRQLVSEVNGLIVQEFIPGDDASVFVTLGYRSAKNGYCSSFSAQKLRQSPRGAGVMALGTTIATTEIDEMTQRLLKSAALSGVICTEFKRSPVDHQYYFIEFNPRPAQFHSIGFHSNFELSYLAYLDATNSAQLQTQPLRKRQPYAWTFLNIDVAAQINDVKPSAWFRFFLPYLSLRSCAIFAIDDLKPWFTTSLDFSKWLLRRILNRYPTN